MNHADILRSSATKVNELDSSYGPRELVFDRAARIASVLLDMNLTAYDVSMIVTSLNLAQLQTNRTDPESYVSSIVNLAFASQFAAPSKEADDIINKGISEAIAKKYSYIPPIPMPNVSEEVAN